MANNEIKILAKKVSENLDESNYLEFVQSLEKDSYIHRKLRHNFATDLVVRNIEGLQHHPHTKLLVMDTTNPRVLHNVIDGHTIDKHIFENLYLNWKFPVVTHIVLDQLRIYTIINKLDFIGCINQEDPKESRTTTGIKFYYINDYQLVSKVTEVSNEF